jgi:hypothetical protein
MNSKRPARPKPAAEPAVGDRSLTELGRPSDPVLAEEIETSELTPALLEAAGMGRLYEVWRQSAGAGAMPRRADIDILELSSYIGELSLLEVVEGGADFRYRVLSEGAAKLLGRDYTGRLLSEVARDADRRERLIQRYRRVVTTKVPWYARTPAVADMPVVYTERLVLPLSEDGASVSMILVARKSGPRRRS